MSRKHSYPRWLAFSLSIFLSGQSAQPAQVDRPTAWREVSAAMEKQLPVSALEPLASILTNAVLEADWSDAARAIARKAQIEMIIQGGLPEEGISRLSHAMKAAPPQTLPILQSIIASWHARYFEENRWDLLSRSDLGATEGPDLKGWSLPRLLREIDSLFQASLTNATTLQALPIARFNGLLTTNITSDAMVPTLYDFLARQALGFYKTTDWGLPPAEDDPMPEAAELQAALRILFASSEVFIAESPTIRLPGGITSERCVELYRNLTRFHLNDADPTALAAIELDRLTWASTLDLGRSSVPDHARALREFALRRPTHPSSADFWLALAEALNSQDQPLEAWNAAQEALRRYPNTPAAGTCKVLVHQLEHPSLEIFSEQVWNHGAGSLAPEFEARYKNLSQVSFRWISLPLEQGLSAMDGIDAGAIEGWLKMKPVAEWKVELAATPDLKLKTATLKAPMNLAPGVYALVASPDPGFTGKTSPVAANVVWVSNLQLITRIQPGAGEALVVDARTGEPKVEIAVEVWTLTPPRTWRMSREIRTDALGIAALEPGDQTGIRLVARDAGDKVASSAQVSIQPRWDPPADNERCFLFTDRAIYRPGQVVSYKGLVAKHDTTAKTHSMMAGTRLVVILRDANGQEVGRQEHVSNPMGSFHGSFSLPKGGLTGSFHLSSQSGPRGHAVISVEEYKRPKFQVRLKQPSDGARLDASLQVEGTAISYTEAPVDGAKVSWRITRQRSLRPWPIHSRGYMPPGSPARVVARGQTVTRTNGSFVIEFTPRAELSEANLEDPVFHFEVHADVTDASGETQSDDTTLKLGNRALDVRTTIDPFLTLRQPKEIQVHTESLDGVPLPRKGTLRVRPLRPPEKIERIRLVAPHDIQPLETPTPNDWRSWPAGDTTSELPFATDATGKAGIQLSLTTGAWRITASAEDRFGRTVEYSVETLVIDETSPQFDLPIAMIVNVPKQSYRPGEVLEGFWGSGYKPVRALVEWMHEGRTVSAQWTERGISQAVIRRPITEAMRGSLTLRVTQVRDNRSFVESRLLEVAEPHPPLELQLVDLPKQLRPGNRENWTVKIHRPEGAEKRMEAVAVLYDASLDAFRTHSWPNSLRIGGGRGFWDFVIPGNQPIGLHPVMGQWPPAPEWLPPPGPREWADDLGGLHDGREREKFEQFRTVLPGRAALSSAPMAMESGLASPKTANAVAADAAAPAGLLTTASGKGTETPPKLSRRVFQETAFFLPALEPDAEGKIQIPFTVPDTLTEWRLMILAHDKSAATGFMEARVATSKDLMVQPNPPRFLREQDELEFTTRVINTTDAAMKCAIRLHWQDAGGKPLTQIIKGRFPSEQSMEIPARESRTATWGIQAPTGVDMLTFRTEATAGNSFDAEEGTIPVLPRRVLTSESLAVLLPKAGTRERVLTNLLASKSDARIEHASLHLELTIQPAWLAVMSLPYLMEFPHECAEQIFHRYYANSLALHLLKTEPGVAEAFRNIRQTGGGASPLLAHSNKTFMTSLPQDTPWLAMGLCEANRRTQLSKLFDDGSLSGEMNQALEKLEKLRTADGLWPWFSGGSANPQITLCIAAGFGKLKAAGVSVPMKSVQQAWQALDRWIVAESRRLQGRTNGQLPVLNSIAAQYLYGRSFFLRELPLPTDTEQIAQEWLGQAQERWTGLRHRQSQAQLALALHRWGRQEAAREILKSLRERSVSSDDEGMYWRDVERRGAWEEAPIETQALMIEAFEQIEGDRSSVESCKLWLLRQKQVQSWETTKATADAVHVLIRSGTSWLSTSKPASVELGGKPVVWNSSNQELPGQLTRGYESGEITPDMGRIKISKLDEGPAWGALHWVYTTDAEKVEAAGGGGLGLQRRFFVRRIQNGAASLLPLQGPVAPGDEIISRIEISVNEDMEFVHLRDPRPSGTEPTTVLSGYRWSGGLGYYVSTRDTASHFYFERLPKGRHVVEHSMRVQLRGRYQAFAAEIQCMYAPEFRSRAATTFIDCR